MLIFPSLPLIRHLSYRPSFTVLPPSLSSLSSLSLSLSLYTHARTHTHIDEGDSFLCTCDYTLYWSHSLV
jgi:hypothetical protein